MTLFHDFQWFWHFLVTPLVYDGFSHLFSAEPPLSLGDSEKSGKSPKTTEKCRKWSKITKMSPTNLTCQKQWFSPCFPGFVKTVKMCKKTRVLGWFLTKMSKIDCFWHHCGTTNDSTVAPPPTTPLWHHHPGPLWLAPLTPGTSLTGTTDTRDPYHGYTAQPGTHTTGTLHSPGPKTRK